MGKGRSSIKKVKGNLEKLQILSTKGGSGKALSSSTNGAFPQSGGSSSKGSSEGSEGVNSQNGETGRERSLEPLTINGTSATDANTLAYNAQAGEANTTVNRSTMALVPPAPVPGMSTVSLPTTNLNIGMGIYNVPAQGSVTPVKGRRGTTNSVSTIVPAASQLIPGHDGVPSELWVQDERELKRQKRKQSNRESVKRYQKKKQDEQELKRQKRKQSNRESVKRYQKKKQMECEELSAKVDTLTSENKELKSEIILTEKEYKKLKSENESLQKVETLTSENMELRNEIILTEKEYKKLKSENELLQKVETLTSENMELRNKLNLMAEEYEELASENELLQEFDTLTDKHKSFGNGICLMEKKQERLASEIESLEMECEELPAKVVTLTSENRALRTEINFLADKYYSLASEIESLKEKLRNFQREDRVGDSERNGPRERQSQFMQQGGNGYPSRESDKRSRMKKQMECEELSAKVETLTYENMALGNEIKCKEEKFLDLDCENGFLKARIFAREDRVEDSERYEQCHLNGFMIYDGELNLFPQEFSDSERDEQWQLNGFMIYDGDLNLFPQEFSDSERDEQ